MPETKLLEVRDRNTFIPVIAIRMRPDIAQEVYLLDRCGYVDGKTILLTALAGGKKAFCDPYDWGDRTYAHAHKYIEEHFDELVDGSVVDVEFILGETPKRKISEQYDELTARLTGKTSVI